LKTSPTGPCPRTTCSPDVRTWPSTLVWMIRSAYEKSKKSTLTACQCHPQWHRPLLQGNVSIKSSQPNLNENRNLFLKISQPFDFGWSHFLMSCHANNCVKLMTFCVVKIMTFFIVWIFFESVTDKTTSYFRYVWTFHRLQSLRLWTPKYYFIDANLWSFNWINYSDIIVVDEDEEEEEEEDPKTKDLIRFLGMKDGITASMASQGRLSDDLQVSPFPPGGSLSSPHPQNRSASLGSPNLTGIKEEPPINRCKRKDSSWSWSKFKLKFKIILTFGSKLIYGPGIELAFRSNSYVF
jgi:hypothetical protein